MGSIVAHVDVSHLFSEGAVAAQFIASTKGQFHKIRPNKEGKIVLSQFKGSAMYHNRRRFAGKGFAVEQHTASLQLKQTHANRHKLEVVVLLRIDPETSKITALEENFDPASMEREISSSI